MIEYEKIFGEDVRSMRKVFDIFQNNLEKREQNLKINDNPRIPSRVDPLYNDLYSNGNELIELIETNKKVDYMGAIIKSPLSPRDRIELFNFLEPPVHKITNKIIFL